MIESIAAAERLSQIEGLTAGLGPLFKSTLPIPLTDNVNEYTVQCSKHIFANHVILEVRKERDEEKEEIMNDIAVRSEEHIE